MNGQEIEAKFHVGNLARVETKLRELGGRLIQARIHEINLRFDTPDHSLKRDGKVLRLRQDENSKMTFKSGTSAQNGILTRKEIEFGVENFDAARQLIESLGYVEVLFYEKYRTTYELDQAHIMLDELPYGDFVEIEAEDATLIEESAKRAGLQWESAITLSYGALFERVAAIHRLDISKLTFEAFSKVKLNENELSVNKAD